MNAEDKERVKRDIVRLVPAYYLDAALAIVECEVDAAWSSLSGRTQQANDRAEDAEARLHDLERRLRELAEKWKRIRASCSGPGDCHKTINCGECCRQQLLSLLTSTPPEPKPITIQDIDDLQPKSRERVRLHEAQLLFSPANILGKDWNAIVTYLCEKAPERFEKAGEK